jgi:hypothetical protein
MRKLRFIALAASLVLAVAGIAIARSGGGADRIEPATATFTAAPDNARTRTCEGSDGTYRITRATYRGNVSGDPRLTGALEIRATSVVNQDTGLGFTHGTAKVRDEDRRVKAHGRLDAVNTQLGKLDGFLRGHTHQRGGPHWRLLANFSAGFNAEGTQLGGEIGADLPVPPTNSAVFHRGRCKRGSQNQGQQQGQREGRGPKGPRGPRDPR